MKKTILITGATDGIGLGVAQKLVAQGHRVLLHGRNGEKLKKIITELSLMGQVDAYVADLSDLCAVRDFAKQVMAAHGEVDVLINNAGVLQTAQATSQYGLDVRFVVNAIAPYLLTQLLLPVLGKGRVINVSSAAQAPVDLNALAGQGGTLQAMDAYAQSKLALIMWSNDLAKTLGNNGPMMVAVNPGSFLASKMVKEGFGMDGNDINIGIDVLVRASLSEEFSDASGQYFDNDLGRFSQPHADASDPKMCRVVAHKIQEIISDIYHASPSMVRVRVGTLNPK